MKISEFYNRLQKGEKYAEKNGHFLKEILRLMSTVKDDKNYDFNPYLFKKGFLSDFSSTKGNLNAVEHIEYGEYICEEGMPIIGLKIKDKNISLVDLFFDCIENNELVEKIISNNYPDLTADEISAALRFITVVLIDMECEFLGE